MQQLASSSISPAIAVTLLQQLPDALILTNYDGVILFANQAVQRIFGYMPEALIQQPLDILIPERFRANHAQYFAHYIAKPYTRSLGSHSKPLYGRHCNGSEFPVWISLTPTGTDNASITVLIRDVTEIQSLLAQQHAARVQAEETAQIKSQLLATASHDLRQPLQTLQLLNDQLRYTLQQPQHAAAIATQQHHAITHLIELFNALLDISKFESGIVQLNIQAISITDIFTDIEQQFTPTAQAKKLHLHVSSNEARILTDRILLKQLLQNLVANAVRYTEHGTVTLSFELTQSGATITVTDTGPGIPTDQITKIFTPFYRSSTQEGNSSGVGLGLAIVQHITALLGYTVQVDSQPGAGSAFRINIPSSQLSNPCNQPMQPACTDTAQPAPNERAILILEDDAAVRTALALTLELEGFIVYAAESLQTAQTLLQQQPHPITALVCDHHLAAAQSGVTAAHILRAQLSPSLPIVFLTGDNTPLSHDRLQIPLSIWLTKPVNAQHLTHALRALLAQTEQHRIHP